MPEPPAILFDFDGVLADTEPLHWACWRDVLKPEGIELSWERYRDVCIGVSDYAMLEALGRTAKRPRTVGELWPLYPVKKRRFAGMIQHETVISGDVVEMIKQLDSIPLGVVTSSARSEIEPILKQYQVLDRLGACVYGNEVERHKPDPQPYVEALRRLGVATALVFEDSAAGVASATAAGCAVVRVAEARSLPSLVWQALRRNHF